MTIDDLKIMKMEMLHSGSADIFDALVASRPELGPCRRDIEAAFAILLESFRAAAMRCGLTRYMGNGWVAADECFESVSRTCDFGLDDMATASFGEALGHAREADELGETLAKIGGAAGNVRLVGFDDVEVAGRLGITSVRQPLDAIAETAFQALVSRLKTPTLPPRIILLDAGLTVRDSPCPSS